MHTTETDNWAESNQRYLMARLGVVREALKRRLSREPESADSAETSIREAAAAMTAPSALDNLCAAFALSPFERDVLLLCGGMELDGEFAAICSAAHGNSQRAYPTFGLALAVLPEAHWSALTPTAPLRRWRLIENGPGETLTTSPLRIDERVLHYLAGISYVDDRLRCLIELHAPPDSLPPSLDTCAERIKELWVNAGSESPVVHLAGDERGGKRAVAAYACAALGLRLYLLHAADVPPQALEREALARLWERESVLNRSALLLDCEDAENKRAAFSFLDQVRSRVLAA